MPCQRISEHNPITDGFHKLFCAECRTHRKVDKMIAKGITQLQNEPINSDNLQQMLQSVGLSQQNSKQHFQRTLWLAGAGMFVSVFVQPEKMHYAQFAKLDVLSSLGFGLFWLVVPILALWLGSDYREQRKSVLLGSLLVACVLWGGLFSFPQFFWGISFGISMLLAMTNTIVGGFLVEQAQQFGASGRLGALQQAMLRLAGIFAPLLGDVFHLSVSPILAILSLLLFAIASYFYLPKPNILPSSNQNSIKPYLVLKQASEYWWIVGIMFLVFGTSGFSTLLTGWQKLENFDSSRRTWLYVVGSMAFLIGTLIYYKLCRKSCIQNLLAPAIVGNAVGTGLYVYYCSPLSYFQAMTIEVVNGVLSSFIVVMLFDLAIRAIPRRTTLLGYAIIMAVFNVSLRLSDILFSRFAGSSVVSVVVLSAICSIFALTMVPIFVPNLIKRKEGEIGSWAWRC